MTRDGPYAREIHEQPSVLRTLLCRERSGIEAIAEKMRRVRPMYGLFAGRGSSDNAARYAQYVLGVRNHLVCALATPSVSTVYESPPNMKGSITIGFSQSGQSPDIVQVVATAARQGAMTVALTNDLTSPLARAAEHSIFLHAGTESAVPATKTYTAELMAMAMFSASLQDSQATWEQLEQVPDALHETLESSSKIVGIEAFEGVKQLVVVARGFNYATAFETALKISETTAVVALPFSSADLLHGPVAMLGPQTPMILISPRGKVEAQVSSVLGAAKARRAPLIVFSDDDRLLRRGEVALRLPSTPEWLSPISAIVAGQLFSAALAGVKQREPDDPAGLSKITRTY